MDKTDNDEKLFLPKLNSDDYLTKDYYFWKNYRETLYKIIKLRENEKKIEKTPDNIIQMAQKIGIKPTARYFNIEPSQVRYWIKKNKN